MLLVIIFVLLSSASLMICIFFFFFQVVRERDAALEVARKSEDGKLELTARLALASKVLSLPAALYRSFPRS